MGPGLHLFGHNPIVLIMEAPTEAKVPSESDWSDDDSNFDAGTEYGDDDDDNSPDGTGAVRFLHHASGDAIPEAAHSDVFPGKPYATLEEYANALKKGDAPNSVYAKVQIKGIKGFLRGVRVASAGKTVIYALSDAESDRAAIMALQGGNSKLTNNFAANVMRAAQPGGKPLPQSAPLAKIFGEPHEATQELPPIMSVALANSIRSSSRKRKKDKQAQPQTTVRPKQQAEKEPPRTQDAATSIQSARADYKAAALALHTTLASHGIHTPLDALTPDTTLSFAFSAN